MTARRKARKAKRAEKRQARRTKRAVRKQTRQAKRATRRAGRRGQPAQPSAGLAELTSTPGMQMQAGGPSLAEIADDGAPQLGPIMPEATVTGGLSGIQAGTDEREPEPEYMEVEQVEEPGIEGEGSGEDQDESNIIGQIGQAVGGILKGLNINSGNRQRAKNDAQLQAYNARVAAAQAAAPQKSNKGMYIGIAIGVIVLVVVILVVVMKKKR